MKMHVYITDPMRYAIGDNRHHLFTLVKDGCPAPSTYFGPVCTVEVAEPDLEAIKAVAVTQWVDRKYNIERDLLGDKHEDPEGDVLIPEFEDIKEHKSYD